MSLKDMVFQMPGKVEVGFSKSSRLGEIIKEEGFSRVLLVIDSNLRGIKIFEDIIQRLSDEKIALTIYDEIRKEPTVEDIDTAIKELKVPASFDCVLGIGGGSAIDLAKLLAVSAGINGSVKDYVGTGLIESSGLPMVVLPTTSGTGAEATPNAIVKDLEEECKKGIVSPYLIPDLVVLDPELTISLPAGVTAATGIDAFTHAIECFICNKSNPMSDLFAVESMRLISGNLRQAVRDGGDKTARYQMALGSFYGGVAITNSGTGGVHALAYPLGGKYGVSHGLSNAILLADVMDFNAAAVPEKFVRIAEVMGCELSNCTRDEIINSALAEIRSLVNDVGISNESLNIREESLAEMAEAAMSVTRLLQNNPRPIKYEDAYEIYQSSLIGD